MDKSINFWRSFNMIKYNYYALKELQRILNGGENEMENKKNLHRLYIPNIQCELDVIGGDKILEPIECENLESFEFSKDNIPEIILQMINACHVLEDTLKKKIKSVCINIETIEIPMKIQIYKSSNFFFSSFIIRLSKIEYFEDIIFDCNGDKNSYELKFITILDSLLKEQKVYHCFEKYYLFLKSAENYRRSRIIPKIFVNIKKRNTFLPEYIKMNDLIKFDSNLFYNNECDIILDYINSTNFLHIAELYGILFPPNLKDKFKFLKNEICDYLPVLKRKKDLNIGESMELDHLSQFTSLELITFLKQNSIIVEEWVNRMGLVRTIVRFNILIKENKTCP